MWTLGKTAALAATARRATRQQERTRRLGERIDLAREIHERVMQRLFGVSLVLSAQQPMTDEQRERCRTEMVEALADLRSALERPLAPVAHETGTTLRAEIPRLTQQTGLPVATDWPDGVEVPPRLEGVAQSVLAEALRNAAKHAEPERVDVRRAARRRRPSRWRSATTACARTGRARPAAAWACGSPPSRRSSTAASSSSAPTRPARAPGWRVRLVVPVGRRAEEELA